MKYKFKLLMAALAIMLTNNIVAQTIPSYVPTNGLVGWYPFNGNANDESNFSNHGTVSGATLTTDRFGENNKAYSFNKINNAHINLDTNSAINSILNDFTISYWVELVTGGTIFSSYSNQRNESGINSYWRMVFHIGTCQDNGFLVGGGAGAWQTSKPCNSHSYNKWEHILIVRQGSNLKTYVNAKIVDSSSVSNQTINNPRNPPATTRISSDIDGKGGITGKIDDIGFWNRALNQQEITDLFKACSGTNIITQPQDVSLKTQDSALFLVSTTTGSATHWQTNPLNIGWHNVPKNNSNYIDTTNTLIVKNTTFSNHNQAFRVIVNNGGCVDTSEVVKIMIQDTCIETVFDTILTSVSDTLKFNINLSSFPPPSNQNLITVYPNPTNSQIIIDNGNFTSMNNYIIKIEDAISRQVFFSKVTQQQFTVDISTMGGKGLYFLSVLDSSGKLLEVKKIVLE